MAVTVTPTPASPVAVESFTKFAIAGLTLNDDTAYNAANVPTEPEVRYYLTFEEGGAEHGRSPVFACNADGEWEFNNYLFPHAGSWTVEVRLVSDDSSVKSQAVTVS
jgi:hypothetical protein